MFILERPESLSDQFGKGLGEGVGSGLASVLQGLVAKRKDTKENEALKRLTGKDFEGLSPETKKEFLKLYTGAHSQRAQEKQQMLETGLGTIKEMRDLLDSAGGWTSNIGNKLASFIPGTETQQKRTKLSQLGTSLIPLASAGVSIRNQREFEQYKKIITDPDSSEAQLSGALDGLESIISRQISNPMEEEEIEVKEKPLFDIGNVKHKKARDALMKKYKGDRKRVMKELSKYYREE